MTGTNDPGHPSNEDDPDSSRADRARIKLPTGMSFVADGSDEDAANDAIESPTGQPAAAADNPPTRANNDAGKSDEAAQLGIKEFYDTAGWSAEDGVFQDTRFFTDNRPIVQEYNRRCMRRLNRYFRNGGRYLLDAGGGAIPHPELLDYDRAFEKRICVDLSERGLAIAQEKLGARGVCMQGDLLDLPLPDGAVDAVTCNHVIYQIPAADQPRAFEEIWRVLKPGGVAVIVYRWPYSGLERILAPIARALTGVGERKAVHDQPERPNIPHEPQPYSWFRSQPWPFRHHLKAYRILSHEFMQANVADNWRGALFLRLMSFLESAFPFVAGRWGAVPTIVLYKDE